MGMNLGVVLKAGFMGFILAMGVLVLVFYLVGSVVRVTQRNFLRVFILGSVVSFATVYFFLHYKINMSGDPVTLSFLSGCIGGWLGGIFAGLTYLKRLLLSLRK